MIKDKKMRRYSSCGNYFSCAEMERLLSTYDLNLRISKCEDSFCFVLYSEKLGLDLGKSRRFRKIPSYSKFPHLSVCCCCNRWVVEEFGDA